MESYPIGSEQPQYTAHPTSSNKLVVSLSFLVACLLFLLPFAEFKCENEKFAEATGIGLVSGNTKTAGRLKTLENYGNRLDADGDRKATTVAASDSNEFAIAAIALGVAGLLLSIFGFDKVPKVCGVIAVLCVIAMAAIQFDLRSNIAREEDKYLSAGESFDLSIRFTVWYYVSVLAFLAAALFSFRKKPLIQTVYAQPGEFPVTTSKVPPGSSDITAESPRSQD